MEETLLNDDFIDYVILQMSSSTTVLNNIKGFRQFSKKYTAIIEAVENLDDEEIKRFFSIIIDCFENMLTYENAFAYYLGMKHTFNMTQLEQV